MPSTPQTSIGLGYRSGVAGGNFKEPLEAPETALPLVGPATAEWCRAIRTTGRGVAGRWAGDDIRIAVGL